MTDKIIMKAGTSGKPAIPIHLTDDRLVEEVLSNFNRFQRAIIKRNDVEMKAIKLAIQAGGQAVIKEVENFPIPIDDCVDMEALIKWLKKKGVRA